VTLALLSPRASMLSHYRLILSGNPDSFGAMDSIALTGHARPPPVCDSEQTIAPRMRDIPGSDGFLATDDVWRKRNLTENVMVGVLVVVVLVLLIVFLADRV
jgi:hypothetical protein